MLLILFSIIRRRFWDYGRLALIADSERSVHELMSEIITDQSKIFVFFLVNDNEHCVLGSTNRRAVVMETYHPLQRMQSMKQYVKDKTQYKNLISLNTENNLTEISRNFYMSGQTDYFKMSFE